jgi:quinolinate synthase
MGQSASLLSPDKTVLMPDMNAVCPMALMVDAKTISEMRAQYDYLAVVCYINSMAEIKALSDVCVTSSNALKIVKSLPNRNIFFIPDGNLGRFIKEQCPDKNVILNRGYCHVHTTITARAVEQLFGENPDAEILVHPECISEVCELADFVGSTKEIIEHAASSPAQKFIVCTEYGVLHELKMRASQKEFIFPGGMPVCNNMKKVTLEKVRDCLKNSSPSITVSDEIREAANRPLERMLQLG